MNKTYLFLRSLRIAKILFLAAIFSVVCQGVAAADAVPVTCVGGTALNGLYGFMITGGGTGGRFLSGALNFNGACSLSGSNLTGGINGQVSTTSATGTYGQNSDGTYNLSLTLANQTTPLTFTVGVSASGTKAVGIESDGTAIDIIDIESQLTTLTNGYSTASLSGTYSASCFGSGVDLNYVTFDGKGNLTGVDPYDNGGSQGNSPYSGTYSVNSDGTFSGALAGGYSQYSFSGVLDNGVTEIQYTYNQSGDGEVVACTGRSAPSAVLSGYYGMLVGGNATNGLGGGRYLSGSVYFNGAGSLTATNLQGGINTQYGNTSATGTYVSNGDGTVTITMNLVGQTAPQTYIVGVSEGGNEAVGIETDGLAAATIDLQSQLVANGSSYSNASLNGTYAATCAGGEVDLNYVTFDGNGNQTGVDPYDNGNYGDNPYTGTYSVNSDGTFSGGFVDAYAGYTLTGVIDNATSEIEYTYDYLNQGGVVYCWGFSTYGPVGAATVAATPTFSPAPGSYSSAQPVMLTSATSGATIYYTTNGVTPTASSLVYSKPITVSATTTIEAIAVANNYNRSAIGAGTYFFGSSGTPTAATPTFNPLPGTFSSTQTVTLSDTTSGAVIHCTTNGTTPTASSPVCTTVTVSATTTIEALAVATGYNNSVVATGLYTIAANGTPIVPYIQVGTAAWQQISSVSVASGSIVNLGPQPLTGGSWSWTGPNGYTSTSRQINSIPLSAGANLYTATYTNTGGVQSAQIFTITVTGGGSTVNLSTYYNVYGLGTVGTGPRNGGFDNSGYAYNSSLLGASLTYQGLTFPLGAANAADAVQSQTVSVTPGQYGQLYLLGAAANGSQLNQTIVANYTDGTSSTFTQSFSDWTIPKGYTGESTVIQTANRITPSGSTQNGTIDVYGYTFSLTSGKSLSSVKLPSNRNVVIVAMGLSANTSTNLIPNGTYTVTSVHSGLAIDDPGFSKQAGQDMQQYTLNNGTNQQWIVNNLGNNVITLTNVSSNLLLDVVGASKSNSALVDQNTNTGTADEQWTVISVSGGAYELLNVNSGLALDVDGGGTTVGELIDQYPYKGNSWQQWKFNLP
jgi:hypothetical protein